MGAFNEAHGGVLREGFLGEKAAKEEIARDYVTWDWTNRIFNRIVRPPVPV